MRVSGVSGLLAVGAEEGFDVVADEDTGMCGCEGAVEDCFILDGFEEGLGVACGTKCVEGSARPGAGLVWRGFGKGRECAGRDVGNERWD